MNKRRYPGLLPMRGVVVIAAVVAVVYLVVMSVSAASDDPQSTVAAPSGKVQIRDKPIAAGRNKAAAAAEAAARKQARKAAEAMDLLEVSCDACHVCDSPAKENLCLRACPRSVVEVIVEAAHEALPDDVILLNAFAWEDRRFMPVPFNHTGHAEMAGMSGGCQLCHHHTMDGQIHPSCKKCHEPIFAKSGPVQLRMPALKGAYHRQCMGCHRDWAHNTKCATCHLTKGDESPPVDPHDLPSPADIAGHPLIENPERIHHETEYEKGPHVVFRHKEHVDRYGYGCEFCHKGQSCARCHERAETTEDRAVEALSQPRHSSCFPCHEDDACERCHAHEKDASPKRFDHAVTGFTLGRYHAKLTCRACHRRLFFTRKLEGKCSFCHKDWEPDTFDHAATGQVLDENHAEIDCDDCHRGRTFRSPPSCDECHDEDISFPGKRPGPVTPAD